MIVNAFMRIEPKDLRSLVKFLAVGSAFGAVFATLTFATAVFSLTMIADRDVDIVKATVSSIHAVLRNKRVTFLWTVLIDLLTLLGFAKIFLGLAVVMPWLAYSILHSYREALDASIWPKLSITPRAADSIKSSTRSNPASPP